MEKEIKREVFESSRESEYFTEKELTAQLGHSPRYWPICIVREMIDNALDACETAAVLPDVIITTENDIITVEDNGPGIAPETLVRSLDYLVRVSDKIFCISPSRGQMGSALKTLWAAPYVSTGKSLIEVASRGEKHTINVTLDRLAGKPVITHKCEAFVKNRSFFCLHWKDSSSLLLGAIKDFSNYEHDYMVGTIEDLVQNYVCLNPHATFFLNGKGYERTIHTWKKWIPNMPTSAHWYSSETLRDLVAGYIGIERRGGRKRTVREFVTEFRGLSGSAKQKEVVGEWSKAYLSDFIKGDDIDNEFISALLDRMIMASTPPKPELLGTIGETHLTSWMQKQGIRESTIKYCRKKNVDGLPYVLEVAFGVNNDYRSTRRVLSGLNWSPSIDYGVDEGIREAVQEARLDAWDPVTLVVHIARPRFQFMDRGKTRLELGRVCREDIQSAISNAAKAFTKAKRHSEKNDRPSTWELDRISHKPSWISIRDAAFLVMDEAYNKASSNGRYHANARQIMYAARPLILEMTGHNELNDVYFTQNLLKDYIETFRPEGWRVVWDARGNITEPYTHRIISLGGLAVKNYTDKWISDISDRELPVIAKMVKTFGPANRFNNALFIEKEGFMEILNEAEIPELYSMALLSTKGLPVDASCDLINLLVQQKVRVFVLHDFDYSGFKILRTLREGTRLSVGSDVIDLGLRYDDIHGLQSEPVAYKQKKDPRKYLIDDCGASQEEADFLVSSKDPAGFYTGQRVEINAMTSAELVYWLERKLAEHIVERLVPDAEIIEKAYKRAMMRHKIIQEMKRVAANMDKDYAIPDGLREMVMERMRHHVTDSWDTIVWEIVREMIDK